MRTRTTWAALVTAVALGLPLLLSSYQVALLTKVLIFAIFAMSLDLILGYGGLPSLGHAAYFGAASYTVSLLAVRIANRFWIDFPAGIVVAAAVAALFGLLALRTHESYFLMITLALSQVLWGIAFGWRSFTGGDDGIPRVPRPDLGLPWSFADDRPFYYLVLVCFGLVMALLWTVVRSPFGQALVGIRENEVRMAVLGYRTWLYQYCAFVLAGLLAGVAGGLFAYYNRFVSPSYLSIAVSATGLLMTILGGAGTLVGSVLGAAVIVFLEDVVSAYTERWLLVVGVSYVVITVFAPEGVLGLWRERAARRAA